MIYEEEEFQAVYEEYINLTNELVVNFNPLMIAAVMTTMGFSLYRTLLSEDDYENMVEAMYELRADITILDNNKEYVHEWQRKWQM